MAYVDGFNIDLFISYAHVDDLKEPGVNEGWVALFEKHLKVALAKRFGRYDLITVWRDPGLQGNQLFDPAIEEAINTSAVFLALTSNGYLKSDYCKQELACFHQKAAAEPARVTVKNRLRIVNLLLYDIPHDEWPDAYNGTTGFPFYDEHGEPLGPGVGAFRQQMKKLIDAVEELLHALREVPASSGAASASEQPADAVFMAAADMSRIKRRVIADLEGYGIDIVSGIPPPYQATDHDEQVAEALKGVDLSIHLMDDMPGRPIEGVPGKTYLQRQVELALDHAPSQLIWVPRALNVDAVEDQTHRAFLHRLEDTMQDQQAYHFIRSAQTDIVRLVRERLQQLRQNAAVVAEPSLCLLDTHMQDESAAFDIAKKLKDQGIRPFITQEADDPLEAMALFERRLRQTKNLIIFFGLVSRGWVQRRIEMAMKIALLDGWFRELKLGVFLAPPPKQPDGCAFRVGPVVPEMLENPAAILTWLARKKHP